MMSILLEGALIRDGLDVIASEKKLQVLPFIAIDDPFKKKKVPETPNTTLPEWHDQPGVTSHAHGLHVQCYCWVLGQELNDSELTQPEPGPGSMTQYVCHKLA